MANSQLIRELQAIVGKQYVLHAPEDLLVYEYDATIERGLPEAVVLPATAQQVAEVVKVVRRHDLPVVARGAGTGLSGGAIPAKGGVTIAMSRMRRILEVDVENRLAVVEPGVINLDISKAVARHGLYYAADPSSQKACTIGGNVAENAGGPHCLAYGVTQNHILGLEVVLADGSIVWLGGKTADRAGLRPARRRHRLRGHPGHRHQGHRASLAPAAGHRRPPRHLRRGRSGQPGRLHHHRPGHPARRPGDDGQGDHGGGGGGRSRRLPARRRRRPPHRGGRAARNHSLPRRSRSRPSAASWGPARCASASRPRTASASGRGARAHLGALGRLAPSYYILDGTVPRTQLPRVLRGVYEVGEKYGLRIANVFHAGDGNLHPNILFDEAEPGQVEKVVAAGAEILRLCVDAGGTITGEHGIGMEKRDFMRWVFSEDDIEAQARIKIAFGAGDGFNPEKIFPASSGDGDAVTSQRSVIQSLGPDAYI